MTGAGLYKLSPYHSIDRYVNGIFRWNGLKLFLIESDNFTIEFWDSKKNLPVMLLLPAFAADAKYSWFRQVRSLGKHYRLIIPNLLFFGRSSMKEKSFGISDQVEAVNRLMIHLSISEISICSASYGSVVAAEFANLGTVTVQKLVMTNAPFITDSGEAHKRVLSHFGIAKKSDLLVPENAIELKRLFSLSYFKKPFIPEFVFRSLYKHLYSGKTDEKKKLIDTCFEELSIPEKTNYMFNFPVLLLWGAHDFLVPLETAKDLQKQLGPMTSLKVIDRTAHMPNFEKPRTYNKYLLEFLLHEK